MTKKTRYFVITAGAVLVVGLGGGLVAYLAYNRMTGVPAGLPDEVRYVPADAEVVAFANVRAIMDSELRRALMPSIDPDSRKGKQMMNDFAGVDLEKQVDHVVMYVEPFIRQSEQLAAPKPSEGGPAAPKPNSEGGPAAPKPNSDDMPRASLLVHGSFDQARIEQVVRDHGGTIEEHNGRKLFTHQKGREQVAVGFIAPQVIAIGQADLVRRTIDISRGSASEFHNITTNRDMMNLMRDTSGSTAWIAGQFEEITRRMRLPSSVSGQVPPVRLVSAKADINGGVKATIRAEAGDKAAADQLRDVVRGFITLARMHGAGNEQLAQTLKTVELSGDDTTVRLSFSVTPQMVSLIVPRGRRGGGPGNLPEPPNPPQPPAPPK